MGAEELRFTVATEADAIALHGQKVTWNQQEKRQNRASKLWNKTVLKPYPNE
jgi:hypothetical protein